MAGTDTAGRATGDKAVALELIDVWKQYRLYEESGGRSIRTGFHRRKWQEFWALRGVSVRVAQGEVLGIIGGNGSGKSTIARVLGGVYRPTKGSVRQRGRVLPLIELGAGFHPDLSGRENISLTGAVYGLKPSQTRALEPSVIEFADIGEFIDAPLRTYSSGMRARLAFALASHLEPDVLIADEIFAVGDREFTERSKARMLEMARSGGAVVMVSHNLGLVESMTDSVAWLDAGQFHMIGEPSEVVAAYKDDRDRSKLLPLFDDAVAGLATGDDLVIHSVEVLNEEGPPRLRSGAAARVNVVAETSIPLAEVEAEIEIQHQLGPLYLGATSGTLRGPATAGKFAVSTVLEALPLPRGVYQFKVVLRAVDAGGVPVEARAAEEVRVAKRVREGEVRLDLGGDWAMRDEAEVRSTRPDHRDEPPPDS